MVAKQVRTAAQVATAAIMHLVPDRTTATQLRNTSSKITGVLEKYLFSQGGMIKRFECQ